MKNSFALEKSAVPVWRKNMTAGPIVMSNQKDKSSIKSFAESVILQSIEDLFDSLQRKESIDFFRGEGFRVYAKIAGLSTADQIRIIRMLANAGFKKHLLRYISPKKTVAP